MHVRTLPRTLEDIDSINFALGVEHFDVASHRPHPPGYPLFVALAKASTGVIHALEPSWDRDRSAATGLAVWGLVAGTLAPLALIELWLAIGLAPPLAVLAAIVAVASPLFWFTAARPISDVPGLIAALVVQTWFLTGLRVPSDGPDAPLPRQWVWAAFGAGLIIGLRSQTMWLTGPLLFWSTGMLVADRRYGHALRLISAAALGTLVWAVPLMWLSGGIGPYLRALRSQGTQDFVGVEMLATSPSWRVLRAALSHTFVQPWQTAAFAYLVLALGLAGLVRLAWGRERVLAAILIAFWPYLVFHMVFHETVTLRYGLPLVVPVAGLAVIGASILGVRAAGAAAAAAVAVSLVIGQPPLRAYSRDGAPVFRAFQDMQRALPAMTEPPVLRMHHQVWWGVRRVTDWYRAQWDMGPLPFPGDREWLGVVSQWVTGDETRPVWFLADPTRTDLATFDPRARTLSGRYDLPPNIRRLMLGARLESLNWWSIQRPVWMLGTGWSLTPEIAGMTSADAAGPHQRPANAFLRAGRRPLRVLIGGRYLGLAGGPAGLVSADLAGQSLARWRVSPDAASFLQWLELPDGVPESQGPYARLSVRAAADVPGRTGPAVGLEQFDAAPTDQVIYAFDGDWHELEANPASGRLWRWTSDHSTLVIRGAIHDLTLQLSGESPLRYFSRPPQIVVRAGTRELSRFQPSNDFDTTIGVPAAALEAAAGRVTIDTDLTFVPADRSASPDRRKLGLRLFRVDVR